MASTARLVDAAHPARLILDRLAEIAAALELSVHVLEPETALPSLLAYYLDLVTRVIEPPGTDTRIWADLATRRSSEPPIPRIDQVSWAAMAPVEFGSHGDEVARDEVARVSVELPIFVRT